MKTDSDTSHTNDKPGLGIRIHGTNCIFHFCYTIEVDDDSPQHTD